MGEDFCKFIIRMETIALLPNIACILFFNIPTPGDFWW